MSDEMLEEFEKHLSTLKWVVGVGWALLAGAFALGIWVASLEIRQVSFREKLVEHDTNLRNHGTEINGIHVKQAINGSDLAYIKATVERIEKKLP